MERTGSSLGGAKMVELKPLAGLVGLVMVIAMLGGLAFLGVSNTDLANYNTSAAQARAMDQKTEQEARKAEIDLQAYQQSVELQMEAEKQEMTLALQQMAAEQQQKLEHQRALDEMRVGMEMALRLGLMITGGLIMVITFGTLAYLMARFARSHFPEVGQMVIHEDPELRHIVVRLARENERVKRTLAQVSMENHPVSNHEYSKLFQGKHSGVRQ